VQEYQENVEIATSALQIKNSHRNQRTLKQTICYAGIGLHTGVVVDMRLTPAPPHTGIVFKRMDLPGEPLVAAHISQLGEASDRCTTIGHGIQRIYTVEHLLAALYACQIDNVYVELSNFEPPIANGSSDIFVELIEDAGYVEQAAERALLVLQQPLYWSQGERHVIALPSPTYRISYTLSYPNCNVLRAQYYSCPINSAIFKHELAACRTFCLYEEINALTDRGLIKGGSLDNAVVICGEAVLSKGGLHFDNEMVRHKILDMVGDLALVGCDLQAHIIAVRAGHAAHCAMAQQLYQVLQTQEALCLHP
jgi:UDP-3-O-[3-hydroxymyristoyl] N-acetylglucosamine deacetylase